MNLITLKQTEAKEGYIHPLGGWAYLNMGVALGLLRHQALVGVCRKGDG